MRKFVAYIHQYQDIKHRETRADRSLSRETSRRPNSSGRRGVVCRKKARASVRRVWFMLEFLDSI